MKNKGKSGLRVIGFTLGSLAWAFATTMVAAALVSGLPRSTQGESVLISWPICVITIVLLQVGLPCVVISLYSEKIRQRIALLMLVFVALFLDYIVFGGGHFLFKAWSRGI